MIELTTSEANQIVRALDPYSNTSDFDKGRLFEFLSAKVATAPTHEHVVTEICRQCLCLTSHHASWCTR